MKLLLLMLLSSLLLYLGDFGLLEDVEIGERMDDVGERKEGAGDASEVL